ncbi:hypothetical protein [Klebsiella aerogenes]|uniref:hypothetical protein n=1 Tax=Klebsiella aerogenes TaxID=548 RepID=UPI002E35308A|nr:hypothetical protein [Klebsiella aerogenes]
MIFDSGDFSPLAASKDPDFVSSFPELPPTSRRELLIEQLHIERKICLREIDALRILLRKNGIDDAQVTDWVAQSDSVLDTLLRYGLGKCGKLNQAKLLVLPWSWRRKCRNHFQ